MAATIGRKARLYWNDVLVGGVQTKSVTYNGEAIDISSDDDDGVRKLIENELDERSLDIAFSGVTKGVTLRAAANQVDRSGTLRLEYIEGDQIEGTFVIAPYSETFGYKDGTKFEATAKSSGAWTYTAAP